jgi:hypothetical protein
MTTVTETSAISSEELEAIAAEELEAALLERSAVISPEAFVLVLRYRELNKLIAPLDAEKKAINKLLADELRNQHVGKFTHDGVVACALIPTTKWELDAAALKEDEPEIAARYTVKKTGTRFDAKK